MTDVRALIERAALAPSSHNTQPWLCHVAGDRIDVFADRTRALPVNDPDDRELVISVGAFVFTLRVAAAAAGLQVRCDTLPEPGDPDLMARLVLAPGPGAVALAELSPAIERRRSWRRAFADREVDPKLQHLLQAAAGAEGAALAVLGDEARRQALAELVARGDHLQWETPSWRRELALWMHPRRQRDGLVVPGAAAAMTRAVVRSFDLGDGVGAKDRQLAEGSPLLTVLGTPGDTPADWLAAGQALQRALLYGVGAGLQASHLNQPVEVTELRGRVQALAPEAGVPQLVLRWGHAEGELPAAPRRALEEILA